MNTLALDLGSTRIKAARIDPRGKLVGFAERDAPPIVGENATREFDPSAYLALARAALDELQPRHGERLGIASQRSTFLLWRAEDGQPVSAAISWQDRSAAPWIDARVATQAAVREVVAGLTGLTLSPHFVGPKLAALFERRPTLLSQAQSGSLRLGTLDTWLIWNWSRGKLHVTDATMAARTLLFEPRSGQWNPTLTEMFGVPQACLPRVLPSSGRADELSDGIVVGASVADQSAGALHAVGSLPGGALINIGTGTFVLVPCGSVFSQRAGYLTSLIHSDGLPEELSARRFALEGTINAGGSQVQRGERSEAMSTRELSQEAFVLVDQNGIGAPHWRADLGPIWSRGASALPPAARGGLAELGLCFRVREILSDLEAIDSRLVVAGGALNEPGFAARLASALGRTLEISLEPEATLVGAAQLARGERLEHGRAGTELVEPELARAPVDEHYERWRRWVRAQTGR